MSANPANGAGSNPAASVPSNAPVLTFAFAKRHGVVVQRLVDGVAEAIYRAGASPASIQEVRRFLGVPLRLRRVTQEQFDQLLRERYEGGHNSAM